MASVKSKHQARYETHIAIVAARQVAIFACFVVAILFAIGWLIDGGSSIEASASAYTSASNTVTSIDQTRFWIQIGSCLSAASIATWAAVVIRRVNQTKLHTLLFVLANVAFYCMLSGYIPEYKAAPYRSVFCCAVNVLAFWPLWFVLISLLIPHDYSHGDVDTFSG